MRLVVPILVFCLAACQLQTEDEARAALTRWLYPGEQLAFGAERRCVAAAYRLSNTMIRARVVRSDFADQAVWHIQRGQAVALQHPDQTPHDLSVALMSSNLARGLGLITAATGPRACMTDAMARGTYTLMMTPGAMLIYDPVAYSVVIADFDRMVAVYLRTRY